MEETKLSPRSATVARAMLRNPTDWYNSRDLALDLGMSNVTVGQILGRFYNWGWLHDRRSGGMRQFQFTSGGDELASEALDMTAGGTAKITTVAKLEEEVARGDMSPALLAAVKRRIASGGA